MANIIIAPEHQSAPKTAPPAAAAPTATRNGGCDPRYNFGQDAPALTAYADPDDYDTPEVAEAERRIMEVSPEQTVEAALQKWEENYALAQNQRWNGQWRWMGRENEECRLINILHPHRFIQQLQLAGISASVDDPFEWQREHGIPVELWQRPSVRLWLNSFSAQGRVGISTWKRDRTGTGVATVTTLQYPLGPEWSMMRFNEYDVPTREKYRGWRTALLALVLGGHVSEAEAERAFGVPCGPAADFYLMQLQRHRAIQAGVIQ